MNSNIETASATKLAEFIRTRQVSPVEVATMLLKRIEQLNPALNAVVSLSPRLLDDAREAERTLMRGNAVGPLHGVPFSVKDTIETAGLRTTSGSVLRANYIPDRDATVVARLKAAGAILLGKTNTAEMAMDYTADNPVFGRGNNPYDLTRTPGGSSGGEAAAIAAGLSVIGVGSDLAGSIRIPAHFCGIAGLKPATGRIPGDGQCPPSAGPYSLGSVIGPLARYCADLQLLFRVMAGTEQQHVDRKEIVTFYTNDDVSPVTSETRAAVGSAAKALADAGFAVEEARPPGVEQALDVWLRLFSRAP